jgi:thiol-disulfide isomerase/thioredoxin
LGAESFNWFGLIEIMKYFFTLSLCAFASMVVLSPVRGYISISLSCLLGFTSFFFLTIFFLKLFESKLDTWKIILGLAFGLLIVDIPIRFMSFSDTLFTLPDALLQYLGIAFGFMFVTFQKSFRIFTTVFGFSIAFLMFYAGYDLWLHKLDFGTFTGKVEAHNLPTKFEAFDESKSLVSEINFKNKIVLLDFWTTSCGACFRKFPKLQEAYEKYRSDPSIMVVAVNAPIQEDKAGQAFQMIREREYSFPVVVTKEENLAEKFGVQAYPTTFVISQNGNIVFKGSIEGALELVEDLRSTAR